ncbi:hypothetical protein [Campylobacter fetus]|uniref:hypothetical protein n=1 Tax=Campylobacter fetus TaxID=196 RepID=UPI00192F312A|nr:hypothetical protein [Campylobacter fetus]
MKYKLFIFASLFILFFSFTSYVIVYLYLFDLRSNGVFSFKNFLLETTTNYNRIIIDSGSNSVHAIDSTMLEKAFGKLTINISDNAGYPLQDKLARLKKFTHKGDIVLLPLEYYYYMDENPPPKIYFDNIFGSLHFYFDSLNLAHKIQFILNSPPSSLLKAIFTKSQKFDDSIRFTNEFLNGKRGDYEFVQKSKPVKELEYMSCEEYIFGSEMSISPDKLSSKFKKNIKFIKQIENENGVKFVFTYPAVAGNECYNGKLKDNFLIFNRALRKFIDENGLAFVGSPYAFPYIQIDNSYYHILPQAKQIHTQNLINYIKNSPYKDIFLR